MKQSEETKKYLISLEIETKLFGIEHSYIYYNICEDRMYILEDIEGFELNDVKLNWFITNDEIIEYARNREVKK